MHPSSVSLKTKESGGIASHGFPYRPGGSRPYRVVDALVRGVGAGKSSGVFPGYQRTGVGLEGLGAWGPGGGAAAGVGQARGCRVPPLGSAARTELRILKAAHSAAQVRNSPVAKSAFYSLPTDAAHSQHDTPPRRASESVR